MIRAICLNPVVDRMYYIDDFCPGRLYRVPQPAVLAGGKGINVARVISQLGGTSVLYTFLGGANGHIVEEDILRYTDKVRLYRHRGETRTTLNIMDRSGGKETEIKESGVEVPQSLVDAFLTDLCNDTAEGDILICSGRALPGMGDDIYRRLGELALSRGASCYLDVDGEGLRASLPGRYTFIKPNINELRALFDDRDQGRTVERLAQGCLGLGVDSVMVSLGGAGAIYTDSSGELLRATVPSVEVVSTIGSGDAAVAGFALAREKGLCTFDALRLSMAAGLSNAMHSAVGSVERSEVEALFESVEISRMELD